MRICQFPGCGAILQQEPKRRKKVLPATVRKFCSLHTRILIQNDVDYSRGEFWIWGYEGKKEVRKTIPKQIVKCLKEIAPLEDYLESDFESDKEATEAVLLKVQWSDSEIKALKKLGIKENNL